MKKLFIICSSIFIPFCISAQKTPEIKSTGKTNPVNNFCNTFKKILDNRHNDFKDLYTWGFTHTITDVNNYAVTALHGRYSSQGYNSNLKIPGAKANFISYETIQGKEYKTYYAYWGNYKTHFPADKKNDELKKLLMACLGDYEAIKVPGEKVEKDKYHMLVNTKYEFRNKNQEKRNEPKIYLLYERDPDYDDENVIFLIIEGNSFMNLRIENENKPDPSTVKDSLLWGDLFDFGFKDPEKTQFSKQLEQLPDYAKDGFKAIKGEEIIKKYSKELINDSWGEKIYSKFKTSFLPEGAEKSEIRYYPDDKSTKFIASYDYLLWPESIFRELFAKIKKELGGDFIVEVDEQSINKNDYVKSQKAVFYRKGSKQPQIELIFNMDEDTITNGMPQGILIVVEASNSQSNITNTQVNKFNEQLSSILADYANNFATIKGEMKTTGSKGNYYSKVGLQGADSVYLTLNWTTRRLDFIAVYPGYSSKEEAREKFNELVAQIDKCKFPCCTFAKTDVSELSNMVVQGWLPFDLFRKMDAAYENILLEVEIHKGFVIDEKSEKIALKDVWQLVLRVRKL
jgi:hypothetical protein